MRKNDEKPLISVIMACYNSEEYIKEAIDSIICQTYPNWELVIVDDNSTDRSVELISEYDNDKIKLVRLFKNRGAQYARNVAIANISDKSEYIVNLDSDDISDATMLEKEVQYLVDNPNISIVGSNEIQFEDDINNPIYVTRTKGGSKYAVASIPFSSPLTHSSMMIRRKDFAGWTIYNEDYRKAQDYEFLFRAFVKGKKMACIEEPLIGYRVRGDSLSHKEVGLDMHMLLVQRRVAEYFGIDSSEDFVRSIDYGLEAESHSIRKYISAIKYYVLLLKANRRSRFLSQKALFYAVARQLYGNTRVLFRTVKKWLRNAKIENK